MYSTVIDDEEYCIKPMNCPGGVLVYAVQAAQLSRPAHLRTARSALVHRHELARRAARPVPRALLQPGRCAPVRAPRPAHRRDRGRRAPYRLGVPASSASSTMWSFPPAPTTPWAPMRTGRLRTNGLKTALAKLGMDYERQRGRRRLLRPEDRLPPGGLARPHVAVRHRAA